MTGLLRKVRQLAEDYSAEFGMSLRQTVFDAMLGTLACMVIAVNATLLLVAVGGGQ